MIDHERNNNFEEESEIDGKINFLLQFLEKEMEM